MSLKVLVVSDDPIVTDVFRGLVGERGEVSTYTGTITKSGLVVLDLAMNESSELLALLLKKRRIGSLKKSVLALVSANPFAITQLPRSGVDALIAKPLQMEQVQALLVGVRARLRTQQAASSSLGTPLHPVK
jgi:AmiR/NasT family two-component response regulator